MTAEVDPVYGRVTGVARDRNLNAIALYARFDEDGTLSTPPAPRHPALVTGEATFKARQGDVGFVTLVGQVLAPRSIGERGFFPVHRAYEAVFRAAVTAQKNAGLILDEDAEHLIDNMSLSPPATYTQSFLAGLFFW